ERIPVSAPEFTDLEKEFQSGTGLAAFNYQTFNLGGGDVPERISGAVVSPTLFPLLGVEPLKGRTFAGEEEGEGHDDVIVISERLWKRRFNSDPALLGQSLLLNGRSYTVVGGMRAGLAILLGAVVFVLLIACANLATMLLARASARERELAIRIALGAGRWRLLRQMLTESVSLALAGAAGGVLLSIWGLELLKQIGARTVPRLAEVTVYLAGVTVTAI